jgi:hypothetical protein
LPDDPIGGPPVPPSPSSFLDDLQADLDTEHRRDLERYEAELKDYAADVKAREDALLAAALAAEARKGGPAKPNGSNGNGNGGTGGQGYVTPGRATVLEISKRRTPEDRAQALEARAPAIGGLLGPALEMFTRRAIGEERPAPVPWASLARALHGGYWPGAHVITGVTGQGKTAYALQVALEAARDGCPVLYVALELDQPGMAARLLALLLGEREAQPVMWSDLYFGENPQALLRAGDAAQELKGLPIRVEEAPAAGWAASTLFERVQAVREAYPDACKAYRPPVILLDFLQLVGEEPGGRRQELRQRIGDAAYAGRECARQHGAVVIMLSSISRVGSKLVNTAGEELRLGEGDPAEFVGLGMESTNIEYSGDSVMCMAAEPRPAEGPTLVHLAIGKLRGGEKSWQKLLFNGSWFSEVPDEVADAVEEAHQNAQDGRSARKQAKVDRRAEADFEAVVAALQAASEPLGRDRVAAHAHISPLRAKQVLLRLEVERVAFYVKGLGGGHSKGWWLVTRTVELQ